MPDAVPAPTIGRIVIFEEDFLAPAIVTKVGDETEIPPAVSLIVFPPDSQPVTRRTVPHKSVLSGADGGSWCWPERV